MRSHRHRRRLALALAVAVAVAVAACAQPAPMPGSATTPEQIRAAASDRNVTIACASFDALLYGKVSSVYMVLDRGVLTQGTVTVAADCASMVFAAPTEAPAAAPTTKP